MKKNIIFITLYLLVSLMGFGQGTYNLNEDRNWISSASYDFSGNLISAGVSYFNTLGKATQSQAWDIKTGKIWASEVRYDEFGRPAFSTLSAHIGSTYGFKSDFIKKSNGGLFSQTDLFNLKDDNSSISIGGYANTLGWYYSTNNMSERYQDITAFPYSRVVFSTLNPGSELRVLGGKKVQRTSSSPEEWIQTYSFSMPMAQELYYAYGTGYFPTRPSVVVQGVTSVTPHYIMGNKTVVRDAHGVESVVFTDSDGRVLASARSGNEDNPNRKKYKVLSPIGEQGYVDIHIPIGCGGLVSFKGASTSFTVYNLITEALVSSNAVGGITLQPGMYRIQENTTTYHKNKHPYVTISGSTINLLDNSSYVGVEYNVNYYDYSLNFYDKSGRLIQSVQPLGFDSKLDLTATRNHRLVSTFEYNSLGQLLTTTSPDEGTAQFKYRKDGQIRFSQNSKQKEAGEFSYTNYDNLGRPVESGVAVGSFSAQNPDNSGMTAESTRDIHLTRYDTKDNSISSRLTSAGIPLSYYKQQFQEGNVVKAYDKDPHTIDTWYSYDIYGRVIWMVQDIEGVGVKTIDYEYDFSTGLVTKVYYQKHSGTDRFVHRYNYNTAGELTKVETSTDNVNFTEQARYDYYETGALKRTVLAENAQGIDYVYNLNGQLKAINHPSRDKNLDPGNDGNNGVAQDLFGFALDYYSGDYSRTNTPRPVSSTAQGLNQYNGNIKSVRWSTNLLGGGNQSGQIFSYNKQNWLERADFGSAQDNGVITTGTDYQVNGITYDSNGNIKTLSRNKHTQNGSNAMDAFTYRYNFHKPNQLTQVEDAVTTPTHVDDLKTQPENNYIYNSIGQLIVDKQGLVIYEYYASGLVKGIFKIVNSNQGSGSTLPKPFTIFEDNFDEFTNPTVVNGGLIPLIPNYNWELLNNNSNMTHELGTSFNLQGSCFVTDDVPMAKLVLTNQSRGFGSTSAPGVRKLLDAVAEQEHTIHLDIIRKKTDGSSKGGVLRPQYPIELEVQTTSGLVIASKTIPASTSFNNCNNEFLKQASFINYTPPTGINSVYLVIKNIQPSTTSEFYIDHIEHTVVAEPSLDLYYDDRGFRLRKEVYVAGGKETTWYVRDASGKPLAIIHQPTGRAVNTEENPIYGAARIGMYNRNTNSSLYELKDHLGNVRATFLKSGNAIASISSAVDYYPFGMPMPNRQIVGGKPYRYGYQGEFAETDPETRKPAFQLRLWDARIGRWLTTDPYGQYDSPYLGMGNNPVRSIDPDGGFSCGGKGEPPCPTIGEYLTAWGQALLGFFAKNSRIHELPPSQATERIKDVRQNVKDMQLVAITETLGGLGYGSDEFARLYMYHIKGENLYPIFNRYGTEHSIYTPQTDLIFGSFEFVMDTGIGGEIIDKSLGQYFSRQKYVPVEYIDSFDNIYTSIKGSNGLRKVHTTTVNGRFKYFTKSNNAVYFDYGKRDLFKLIREEPLVSPSFILDYGTLLIKFGQGN